MAVNPVLKLEDKVQVQDQTRFDASKCFVTKGENPITKVEIRPGADGSFVDVTGPQDSVDLSYDVNNWFLDWLWATFLTDVDTTNNTISFKRIADGIVYVATLTPATYTLASLLTEIAAQLNAASVVVWTAALSTKNEITLTSNENVELQGKLLLANALPMIGITETKTDKEFKGIIIESLPRTVSVRMTTALPYLLWVAADQTARLALTAVTGDYAYQQDTFEVYKLTGVDPTQTGDWTLQTIPANPILTQDLTLTTQNGTISFLSPVADFYQNVYSVAGDALFSTDAMLVTHESDILKWVSEGRNSFLDAHRRSQEKIMQWIDQNGYLNNKGKRVTKWLLIDKEDVRLWSVYMTLNHLFMSFQNSENDVHEEKGKYYEGLMISARQQAVLGIDSNEDGVIDPEERVDTWSGSVRMR